MIKKQYLRGFALLNVMLGTFLLVGIIVLIMQTMSHFHAEQKYRAVGEELAPIVSVLLTQTYDTSLSTYDNLVQYIPAAYLQSLQTSGFDMHKATVEIVNVQA